jgi:predicted amidophosphoribosyltransferase
MITISHLDYDDYLDNNIGICLACGAERDSTEPDAEDYYCSECGEDRVIGLEFALISGKIRLGE